LNVKTLCIVIRYIVWDVFEYIHFANL